MRIALGRVLLLVGFTEPHSRPCAGELLPRLSILAAQLGGGLFLLHFPWGRPRLLLAVTIPLWSPDFPHPRQKPRSAAVWHTRLVYNILYKQKALNCPAEYRLRPCRYYRIES